MPAPCRPLQASPSLCSSDFRRLRPRSMPRVRRTPLVRLAAPVDSVRAAAIADLDGVALRDDAVRLTVADQALGGVFVDLVLAADGPDATVVTTETEGQIDIPFFRWAFRPLVAVSKRRTRRY